MHPQDMRRYFFLPKFIEIFMETLCRHHGRTWSIHVQYTQTESIRLRHFTIRLDSHVTSQLDSHGVASRKSTSGMTSRLQGKRFASIRSKRLESTTFSIHPQSPDQLYFVSLAQIDFRHLESTEGETIRVDSME